MSEWQPIETAPRDGTQVLLYRDTEKQIYVARWTHSEVIGPVWCTPDATMIFNASHWMPLPSPPAISTEEQRASA